MCGFVYYEEYKNSFIVEGQREILSKTKKKILRNNAATIYFH